MGSRAYREAPAAPARPLVRLTVRRRRALHVAAIVVASAACLVALVDDVTVPRIIVSTAVAIYAVALGYGLYGVSRIKTLIAVPFVFVLTTLLVAAAAANTSHSDWLSPVMCAMVASLLEGVPAAWLGWTIGWPIRPARLVEPPPIPVMRTVVRGPPSRPFQASPKPVEAELPHKREEVPLDEVPDSTRPLIFAVRLRRRLFDRAHRR